MQTWDPFLLGCFIQGETLYELNRYKLWIACCISGTKTSWYTEVQIGFESRDWTSESDTEKQTHIMEIVRIVLLVGY